MADSRSLHRGRRLFITGTDTGVGKTLIAAALATALVDLDRKVAVMKPLESGCLEFEGRLWPRDAFILHLAAGGDAGDLERLSRICPYALREPLAPKVAAELEGRKIDPETILKRADSLQHEAGEAGVLIIEGAGGLLAPAFEDRSMADLAHMLGAELLIVARAGLGTVNHSLLSVEAALSRGLSVSGIVLCDADGIAGSDPSCAFNARSIAEASGIPVIGTVPHLSMMAETTGEDAGEDKAVSEGKAFLNAARQAARHIEVDRLFA